jgi:type II secretory pathway pseudopilin PulG
MRWKLLLRRLSVSSPRMSVRSHLPWPLRWAVAALVFGFSAAIALWAFEFGKDIAGLDRNSKEELATLRKDLDQLRGDHARARQVADTSESLLKTERAAQERLALQLRQLESEKLALQEDLGFFERLLPTSGDGLQLRGLQAEAKAPGQLRYQMLVVQNGKGVAPFSGRYEVVLTGQLDGKAWSMPLPGGPRNLQLRQYGRVEGMIDHPPTAVIKAVQARVMDTKGATRATQTLKL